MTIDETIDFYYGKVSDAQRFTMKAMLTSFGVRCFNAAKKSNLHNRFDYDKFNDYIKSLKHDDK